MDCGRIAGEGRMPSVREEVVRRVAVEDEIDTVAGAAGEPDTKKAFVSPN